METIVTIHNESEYNDILRQAVAVIETARNNAARAIVGSANEMHWEIGKLLYDKKLDSKHGDKVVKRAQPKRMSLTYFVYNISQ